MNQQELALKLARGVGHSAPIFAIILGVGASGRPRDLTLFFDIGGDAPSGVSPSPSNVRKRIFCFIRKPESSKTVKRQLAIMSRRSAAITPAVVEPLTYDGLLRYRRIA